MGLWLTTEFLREPELLAQDPGPQPQALLHLCQAVYLTSLAQYEEATAAALQGYEVYHQLADLPLAARCLAQAGEAKVRLSQNLAGESFLGQALALYETAGDVEGVSRCLSGLAWAALNLGHVEAAMAHLQRALEINQQQHDLLGQARVYYTLAAAWLYYYHPENIRHYARQARALFQQMGYSAMVAGAMIYEGLASRVEGNWDEAETVYARVLANAATCADTWLEGWTAQALGRVVLRRGDLPTAERLIQHAWQLRQQSGEAQNLVSDRVWLARLRLAQSRHREALEQTTAAVRQMEAARGEYYVWETPDVYLCHAEALRAAGRPDEASTAIRQAHRALQEFATQISNPVVKQIFMAHWTSVRIEEAAQTGRIRPFVTPSHANSHA